MAWMGYSRSSFHGPHDVGLILQTSRDQRSNLGLLLRCEKEVALARDCEIQLILLCEPAVGAVLTAERFIVVHVCLE